MPVREWDGSNDRIVFDNGDLTEFNFGADWSVLMLLKPQTDTTARTYVSIRDTTQVLLAMVQIGGTSGSLGMSMADPSESAFLTGSVLVDDAWMLIAMDKATGSNPVRRHVKQLGTGSWTRVNSVNIADQAAGDNVDHIVVGASTSTGTQHAAMRMGLLAIWNNRKLADADYEAIERAHSTAALYAYDPAVVIEFNQPAVTPAIEALIGNADQASINETSVVAEEPAWLFGLGVPGYRRVYGPAELGTVASYLYEVPAGMRMDLRSVYVNNPTAGTVKATFSVGADAASTRFVDLLDVPAGEAVQGRRATNHTLEAGEKIQGYCDTAGVVATIDGYLVAT